MKLIAMEQEKNSGILFFISGAANLGSMLFAWDGLQAGLESGGWSPIPVGVFFVFFAGFRAYFAPGLPQKRISPVQVARKQYCMHCGAPLLPPAKFCAKCGKDQT